MGNTYPGPSAMGVYHYDPSTDQWTFLSIAPRMHYSGMGGFVGGKFHLTGGIDWSHLDVFDPVTRTWTSRAPLPARRYSAAYAPLAGKLYVVGGREKMPTPTGGHLPNPCCSTIRLGTGGSRARLFRSSGMVSPRVGLSIRGCPYWLSSAELGLKTSQATPHRSPPPLSSCPSTDVDLYGLAHGAPRLSLVRVPMAERRLELRLSLS